MIDPEEMEVAELFQEIRRIAAAHIHSSVRVHACGPGVDPKGDR